MRAMGQVHLRNQISVLQVNLISGSRIDMTAAIGNSVLTSQWFGMEY